jgi:hypothetical protein
MDILFGTYTCPDHEPRAFGIHERTPKNYIGHLLHPFLPRNARSTTPVDGRQERSNARTLPGLLSGRGSSLVCRHPSIT